MALIVNTAPVYAKSSLVVKAEEALGKKQLQLAFGYANMAVSTNPRDAAAFAIRGKISFALKKISEARNDFDKALALDPNYAKNIADSELYQDRAQCYIAAKQLLLAERDLRAAISIYPSSTRYKLLGEVYSHLNKLDVAVESFTKSIQLDPKDVMSYKERGETYAQMKNFSKAMVDFTKIIELHPNDSVGYKCRAKVYEQLGRTDLARKDHENEQALYAKYE
jgi:tetratricopeptide (TPR) repeat protein